MQLSYEPSVASSVGLSLHPKRAGSYAPIGALVSHYIHTYSFYYRLLQLAFIVNFAPQTAPASPNSNSAPPPPPHLSPPLSSLLTLPPYLLPLPPRPLPTPDDLLRSLPRARKVSLFVIHNWTVCVCMCVCV